MKYVVQRLILILLMRLGYVKNCKHKIGKRMGLFVNDWVINKIDYFSDDLARVNSLGEYKKM